MGRAVVRVIFSPLSRAKSAFAWPLARAFFKPWITGREEKASLFFYFLCNFKWLKIGM